MPTYAKALTALLGAVGTWGVTAYEDNAVNGAEWFGLLLGLSTALGVYIVKNGAEPDPTTSTPDA